MDIADARRIVGENIISLRLFRSYLHVEGIRPFILMALKVNTNLPDANEHLTRALAIIKAYKDEPWRAAVSYKFLIKYGTAYLKDVIPTEVIPTVEVLEALITMLQDSVLAADLK